MVTRREIYAAVGAILILFATLADRMLSVDLGAATTTIGLRGIRICALGQCVTVDEHTGLGTLSFLLGLLSVGTLGAAIALDRVREDDRFWRPAGILCIVWLLSVAVWYADFDGHGLFSFGIGLWAGVAGALMAAKVCLSPVRDDVAAQARMQARESEVQSALEAYSAAKPASAVGLANGDAEAPLSVTPVDGEAAHNADPNLKIAKLRFVAEKVVIRDEGLTASFAGGESRVLGFSSVAQVVARQLPPSLGHGPALLLDFIDEAQASPLRVLPSTDVNYSYLPEGHSEDPSTNARRLIALIAALSPELRMDEGSVRFADGPGDALPFKSEEHFWKYDSRYPT